MQQEQGLIVKALGGFYYVETASGIYECRARGIFRRRETSPVVGDQAVIELTSQNQGTVAELLPRKNEIIRPPIANLDKIFMIVSVCEPPPNLLILDQFLAVSEYKEIEPIIVITKCDLQDPRSLAQIYQNAGFVVKTVSNLSGGFADEIKELLRGSLSAFTGNTGVGKSSFLNALYPQLQLETAQISKKLGRGRHTTRHVELYSLKDIHAYVADTPGFSSMDFMQYDLILKEDLQHCFREFSPYLGECKFTGCSHTVEKGCAVLQALEDGKLELTRHQSYVELYHQAKNIREWERKGRTAK